MSQDDRQIRRATVADAPRIAQMHVESWLETYTGIVPQEILAALSVPRRTLAWESILRDPAGHDDSVVYLIVLIRRGRQVTASHRPSEIRAYRLSFSAGGTLIGLVVKRRRSFPISVPGTAHAN